MQTMSFAVTGAFGYTGRRITHRLLADGARVITLTGHPERPDPFQGQVAAHPFHFDRPTALEASLQGVDVLFNTYWVRFERGSVTFDRAVTNTLALIQAAHRAGVRRLVHISITQADPASPWPYFRAKGRLEAEIQASGMSYAILRPAVIFGPGDILINNIAWCLRRFPVFAIPGDGNYRLQPIYVDDLADLAIQTGMSRQDTVLDAVGPEVVTYNQLVGQIAAAVRAPTPVIHVPVMAAALLARLIGALVKDVLLTRDEIGGLMADLLVGEGEPAGRTSLQRWLIENADQLGRTYASELRRHYEPSPAFESA